MKPSKIVVCGGGGFIGGHLVADLLRQGNQVRSVDVKPFEEWFQMFPESDNFQLDLREKESCERAVADVDFVYDLAADMGGMGFIENNKALCMLSVLINTRMLMATKGAGANRYFTRRPPSFNPTKNKPIRMLPGSKKRTLIPGLRKAGMAGENSFP